MVAKRRLDFSKVTDSNTQQIAKRLRYVERQTRLNRPEMKHITHTLNGTVTNGTVNVTGITNIAQGDTIAERSGDRIRVWRIEIRGLSPPNIDNYLIQQHTTTLPTITDFGSTVGAFTLDSVTNTKFTEWKHFTHNGGVSGLVPGRFRSYQRFKNGIIVKYGGTGTQPVDNGLVVCNLNRTTTDVAVQFSIRVYFTDA